MIDNVSLAYNGNAVLKTLSFRVPDGSIVGLVGPNGAGKTSLLKAVMNLVSLTSGRILLNDDDITDVPTSSIARKGISFSFQLLKTFSQMTVLDNVLVGVPEGRADSFLKTLFRRKVIKESEIINREKVLGLLKKFGLEDKANDWAGSLSFGQKRRLELARLLANEPTLLLLDEPTSGLDRGAIEEILRIIKGIKNEGKTILLVEHNIDVVRSICDEIIVLNFGEKIAQGSPEEVLENSRVISAYIGGST